MSEVSVTLIPATVMAQLSPIAITFVVWPGRLEYVEYNGQGTEATHTLPIEVVPPDLRAPNTAVWIVTKRYGEFSKDAAGWHARHKRYTLRCVCHALPGAVQVQSVWVVTPAKHGSPVATGSRNQPFNQGNSSMRIGTRISPA